MNEIIRKNKEELFSHCIVTHHGTCTRQLRNTCTCAHSCSGGIRRAGRTRNTGTHQLPDKADSYHRSFYRWRSQ